jgi:hypothetical protein
MVYYISDKSVYQISGKALNLDTFESQSEQWWPLICYSHDILLPETSHLVLKDKFAMWCWIYSCDLGPPVWPFQICHPSFPSAMTKKHQGLKIVLRQWWRWSGLYKF